MNSLRNVLYFQVIAVFVSFNAANAETISENSSVENISSALPSVIGISGYTEMSKNLAEPFYAQLDGSLPAGSYVEWIITAEGEAGLDGGKFNNGNNIGMSVLIVFRQAGYYCLTARVRSASGGAGMSRYIRIKVS